MINHDMEEIEHQTSKYSTGVSINLRIDQLWKDSHAHSRAGLYSNWNNDLDCIWSELARDLKDEKGKKNVYEDKQKEFDKFDKDILEKGLIMDTEPSGFIKATDKQKESRSGHYKILRKKQLFLARLENTLGKGTTFDNNEEDDID